MKQCAACNRVYEDESLRFCLDDGSVLTAAYDSAATQLISPRRTADARTEVLPGVTTAAFETSSPSVPTREAPIVVNKPTPWTNYVIIALLALIAGGGVVWLLVWRGNANANSSNSSANQAQGNSNLANSGQTSSPNSNNRNVNSTRNANTVTNTSPSDAADGETWFVIVGTYAKNARPAAEQKLLEVKAAGYDATIIDTNDYPNLSPNYWAVVSGPYSQSRALTVKSEMYVDFPEVYMKSGR
ncbi:MAG: hypothetical protein ABIP75_11810 [Pyrinomonadaceae bacterium]